MKQNRTQACVGEQETETAGEKQTDQILETGSITGTKGKHSIHCLTIIGQVEGHFILPAQNKTTKYEHVIPQLVAIEQDPDIEGLVIILNTVGGDVEAGLAIAELIAGMKKPTVSLVLGGGHSIGVPLACSASYSLIAPSATMTIHPVRMSGLVLGVPQTLSYFDKMQERIVRFVTQNSGIHAERFRELMMNKDELVMDVGTVLDGEAAVREGLIDELGGLSRVVEKLYELIEELAAQKAAQEAGEAEDAEQEAQTTKKTAKEQKAGKVAEPKRKSTPKSSPKKHTEDAHTESRRAAAPPEPEAPPKRRGRKPKAQTTQGQNAQTQAAQATVATAPLSVTPQGAAAQNVQAPMPAPPQNAAVPVAAKRRGRPPKAPKPGRGEGEA